MKAGKLPLLLFLQNKYKDFEKDDLYSCVLCGEVFVNGACLRDPKAIISINSSIEIRRKKYVSRGGFKLEYAITQWNITCLNKCVLDAGSSSGGFTDCLLQKGVELVHAVDVGRNQLDYNLRRDPRVKVYEKTNIMSVSELDPKPDFAVCDLSFRKIKKAASHICSLTGGKKLIALIKPQFECGLGRDFNGVLDDPDIIRETLTNVIEYLPNENCCVYKILESPIRGRNGNREFLFFIFKDIKFPSGAETLLKPLFM